MTEFDDYYESNQAYNRDLKIIWKCNNCDREREEYPDCNENGNCECGGYFYKAGESYKG